MSKQISFADTQTQFDELCDQTIATGESIKIVCEGVEEDRIH